MRIQGFSVFIPTAYPTMGMSVSQLPTAFKNMVKRAFQAIADFFAWMKSGVCSLFTRKKVVPQAPAAALKAPAPTKGSLEEEWKSGIDGLSPLVKYVWEGYLNEGDRELIESRYQQEYYPNGVNSQDITERFCRSIIRAAFHVSKEDVNSALQATWKVISKHDKEVAKQIQSAVIDGFPKEVITTADKALAAWIQGCIIPKLEQAQWDKDMASLTGVAAYVFSKLSEESKKQVQKDYSSYSSKQESVRAKEIFKASKEPYFAQVINGLSKELQDEWNKISTDDKRAFIARATKALTNRKVTNAEEAVQAWIKGSIIANLEAELKPS